MFLSDLGHRSLQEVSQTIMTSQKNSLCQYFQQLQSPLLTKKHTSLRNHVSPDEKEPDFLKGEEGRVHPEIIYTSGEGLGTPWRSAQQAPPVPFGITVPCRRVGQLRPLKGDPGSEQQD